MNVISCFDGIAGARLVLSNLNINITNYFAFEIDKYALKISQNNWNDITYLGDIKDWQKYNFPSIDLVIGGFPCQDLSTAKGGELTFGKRSILFFDMLNLIQHVKPKYFIIENVMGSKKNRNIISDILNIEPIIINSALVTAQNRMRAYWCNFDVTYPLDRNILLKDVIENGYVTRDKSYCIGANYTGLNYNSNSKSQSRLGTQVVYTTEECLFEKGKVRMLTVNECELLQGFPLNYTSHVSKTQRYRTLGNSFTIPVIEHLLKKIL